MRSKLHFLSLLGTILSIMFVFSCSDKSVTNIPYSKTSTLNSKWTTGIGPLRGHEDLTRIAVDIANIKIEENHMVGEYYPEVPYGDSGNNSDNLLIRGNYLTDFPNDFMRDLYSAGGEDWHNSPRLQHLHFLRGYEGGSVESARAACEGIKEKIIAATKLAVNKLNRGDKRGGYILLGHATHIIQDSFAPAHAERGGFDLKGLEDICTYGEEFDDVCSHSDIDLRDRVWRETTECQLDSSERDFDCLKPEAFSAVLATAGYLTAVADMVEGGASVDSRMDLYYHEEDASNTSGYLSCDTL